MTTISTASLAEEFLRGLTSKNLETVMALWTDEGVMEFPFAPDGSSKRFVGKAAIAQTLSSAFKVRTEMDFPEVKLYPMDNTNMAVVEFRGKMTLSSGQPYNNQYIALVEAKDGRLVLFREYFNPLVDLQAGNPRALEAEK